METLGWMLESSSSSGSSSSLALPSMGHILALLTILGIWRFPRVVCAFDPNPQSSSSTTTGTHHPTNHPMFPKDVPPPPPPPRKSPPPPPARQLTQWDSGSDSQSVVSEVSSSSNVRSGEAAAAEPSLFLKDHCPESTMAERHRFLVARDGNEEKALGNLRAYLHWRSHYQGLLQQQEEKHYNLQFDDYDLYDWIVASQTALIANDQAKEGWQWLPRIVRTHTLPDGRVATDPSGCRIVHMIPAQIDDQICSLDTYSLALTLYLDRKFHRSSFERMTLVMDLRPGQGWRNISAIRLLPFIKNIVGHMLQVFPERLSKSVLYPLPFALSWILNAVKVVIDPVTAAKLVVVTGSASQSSPLPLEQLSLHVGRQVALVCEKERLAAFSC